MSIEAFEKREKMLNIKAKLLNAESARINGVRTYSLEEMRARILVE